MGGGVLGAEFDLGYTPKFFGSDGTVTGSRLTTAHGSLMLGIPVGGQTGGGIRPYGVVGVGLISRRTEFSQTLSDITTNDFGYNVGAGVMAFFGDTFGLRGEYRYFRNFEKDDEGLFPDAGTFSFLSRNSRRGVPVLAKRSGQIREGEWSPRAQPPWLHLLFGIAASS